MDLGTMGSWRNYLIHNRPAIQGFQARTRFKPALARFKPALASSPLSHARRVESGAASPSLELDWNTSSYLLPIIILKNLLYLTASRDTAMAANVAYKTRDNTEQYTHLSWIPWDDRSRGDFAPHQTRTTKNSYPAYHVARFQGRFVLVLPVLTRSTPWQRDLLSQNLQAAGLGASS